MTPPFESPSERLVEAIITAAKRRAVSQYPGDPDGYVLGTLMGKLAALIDDVESGDKRRPAATLAQWRKDTGQGK
jgi:hypothetical protein